MNLNSTHLSILYRGPLASCNYDCQYCPFAKHHETAAELAVDRRALERFVQWLSERTVGTSGVFFTPWGEALIRPWYQQAMAHLSNMPHIRKVAIQTNLACRLDWLDACDRSRLGLWCTFHPSQIERKQFVRQCQELDRTATPYSVGVVGMLENFVEIDALRRELRPETYLWINAYKGQADYYREADIRWLESIDPLFRTNTVYHASLGKACRAGQSVIAVDGEGDVRRCHFLPETIGNIYHPDFESCLTERPCTRASCGCHIGYVHLDELKLYEKYGDGLLERIPKPEHLNKSGNLQPHLT